MKELEFDTVAEAWASFEQNVVPGDAPDVVRRMVKIAFYGGASAAFYTTVRVFSEGHVKPAQTYLEATRTELDEFAYGYDKPRADAC